MEKNKFNQKAMLKHIKRSAIMIGFLALITVVVFIYGVIQRIELEAENAALKQRIEVYEAEEAMAKEQASNASQEALKAMESAKAQVEADSIANANK